MFPTLHEKTVTTPGNNGFGALSDCLECKISETLNGEYFLNLQYPLDGLHADDIKEGRLLYALRDNTGNKQLFRIAEVNRDYIARTIDVYAPHISYDLCGYVIPAIEKRETAYAWEQYLQSFDYYGVTMPFTFTGDITANDTTGSTRMERQARTVRGVLLTDNDAIINIYTPTVEFEFDNFTVKFLKSRGTETDITIRYGKNLTAFSAQQKDEGRVYGCVPYFKYDVNEVPHYIYGSAAMGSGFDNNDPTKRALTNIDFTEEVTAETGIELDGEPTTEQRVTIRLELTSQAALWNIRNDAANAIDAAVSVDFTYLDLAKAAEYWNGPKPEELTADIGDFITVIFKDTNAKSEILAVEYDVLRERYETITAGRVSPTLSQTIKSLAGG